MKNQEFEIGETVTFKPYEKGIKAKVVDIKRGMNGRFFIGTDQPDNRIFYELRGIDEPLVTSTTGLSIVESKFYKFINHLHESAMDKLTGEWQRLREFTDRPEIARDLLEYGYIQATQVETDKHTRATITLYR